MMNSTYKLQAGFAALWTCAASFAADPSSSEETWNFHAQTTEIWQSKPAYAAKYSGFNSLNPSAERSHSVSATAAIGWRAWQGGEVYFNPELIQLAPFSGVTGLGGYPNGEVLRNTAAHAKGYVSRLFARQTWNFGGNKEEVESDFNQLAGTVSARRLVVTVGRLSVDDLFDDNNFSHDPRSQFMNWSIMNAGSYDFAADDRGVASGAAVEWWWDDWAVRFARFALPKTVERPFLDGNPLKQYSDQIELERGYEIFGQAGRARWLIFHNRALLARYSDALSSPSTPNLDVVRSKVNDKWGWGVNLEQKLTRHLGAFARLNSADGKTEVLSYAEIDRSASVGLSVEGAAWKRKGDVLGVALARNDLSDVHREYLRRGGVGLLLGDGRLSYRAEQVFEAYYAWQPVKSMTLTADWQKIRNPGFNADRGPVTVASLRLHAEF